MPHRNEPPDDYDPTPPPEHNRVGEYPPHTYDETARRWVRVEPADAR